MFHGIKLFEYGNGKVMLLIEMHANTKDNFCPKKCLGTTSLLITNSCCTDTSHPSSGRIISESLAKEDDANVCRAAAKYICNDEDKADDSNIAEEKVFN